MIVFPRVVSEAAKQDETQAPCRDQDRGHGQGHCQGLGQHHAQGHRQRQLQGQRRKRRSGGGNDQGINKRETKPILCPPDIRINGYFENEFYSLKCELLCVYFIVCVCVCVCVCEREREKKK